MSEDIKALSRREHLAVQGVLSGLTATEALLRAGYSASVARTQQRAVLGKPRILRSIEQALEDAGVSTQLIVQTILRGLEAERGVYDRDGRLVGREPDHAVRLKYLRMVLELRGDLERRGDDEGETWEAMIFAIRARRAGAQGSAQ